MSITSIRGAITVDNNCKEEILASTKFLLEEILKKNDISLDSIVSIFFSTTKDIDDIYPAVAAREIGLVNCGLMCFQEMEVKNSLKMCIRVMVLLNSQKEQLDVEHIYLNKAKYLRPDLIPKTL